MEWSCELTFRFLKFYKDNLCIWDPRHIDYKNRVKNTKAWESILKNMIPYNPDLDVDALKRKKEVLMTSYRKLKKKQGTGTISWFAYDYMDEFLGELYELRDSIKSEENDSQIYEISGAVEDNSEIRLSIESPSNDLENNSNGEQADFDIGLINNSINANLDPLSLQKLKRRRRNNNYILTSNEDYSDDECILYTTLLAKRLKKLPEFERENIMHEIDNIVFKAMKNNYNRMKNQ